MDRHYNQQATLSSQRRALPHFGSDPLGLEVRLRWGDQILSEHFLEEGSPARFTVGTAPGVSFAMGDAKLGGPSFEAVRADGEGYLVRFTDEMKGELRCGGAVVDLKRAVREKVAFRDHGGYAVALACSDLATINLGGVTLDLFFQPAPKKVFVPWSRAIDLAALNVFLVSCLSPPPSWWQRRIEAWRAISMSMSSAGGRPGSPS